MVRTVTRSSLNQDGDAILFAGGGNDRIWAGDGADIIDGGEGDDTLYGEAGDDIYIFRIGSGNDTIIDIDATEGNTDTLWLGSSLTADDITVRREGSNLVVRIIGTSDSATLKQFFRTDGLYRVERIQFMDGTTWEYADIVQNTFNPTENDDVIYGEDDTSDTIHGLGGNDAIYGLGSDDTLNGDEGDDFIHGGDGSDTLSGDEGDDSIFGGDGADTLTGGVGSDTLDGGDGGDTYVIERGDGQDIVYDSDGADGTINLVQFGDGILPEDIALEHDIYSTDLKLTILDTGDTVTIKEWLQLDREGSPELYTVHAVTFADGTIWDPVFIKDMLVKGTDANEIIEGFSRADAMEGGGGDDTLFAREGDDTVNGGAGRDYLFGESGDDTLTGGDGTDYLYGGYGADVLEGGAGDDILNGGYEDTHWGNGNDTYLFGRGAGHDKIYDDDGVEGNVDTILVAEDITPDDVTLQHTVEGLTLTINDTDDKLTVPYWFWNDSNRYQIERIEFADGTVWDVDTIKQMVLQGTSGDDLLFGYSSADTIQGYAGADKIYGRAGNDIIEAGSGADIVEGEDGDDLLKGEDGADSLKGGTGNDTLLGGAGADTLKGDDGSDTLEGGDGADTLIGGDGADILDGGAGADALFGGSSTTTSSYSSANGNDTYRFGAESGQDTVFDWDKSGDNVDTILLDDGIAPDNVTLRRVRDNLQISITGSDATLTVKYWFWNESTEYQVERIEFSDGTVWDVDAIKLAVLAGTPEDDLLKGYSSADSIEGLAGDDDIQGLAGDDYISAGDGNDTVTGDAGNDTLLGGDGLDTLSGGDGNDTLTGGDASDTLSGGDGDDTLRGGAGADTLQGGSGNDTYEFGSGFGQDVVSDEDATAGNLDVIVFDADVDPTEVSGRRNGADLVLSINGTDDTLTVENWFAADTSDWQVEEIRFSDSTTWDADAIRQLVLKGTPSDDVLHGYDSDDVIAGYAGTDTLYGHDGSDFLDGGADNDVLFGGAGNDTYAFGTGYGQDTITDYDTTAGNVDTIVLGADVLPSDVTLTAGDNDLFVSINGTDDSLKLSEWFSGDAWKIEQIQFSDGTVLTPDEMILSGSICRIVHYHQLCKVSKKAGAPRVLTGGRDSRALAAFRPEGTTVLGVAA